MKGFVLCQRECKNELVVIFKAMQKKKKGIFTASNE